MQKLCASLLILCCAFAAGCEDSDDDNAGGDDTPPPAGPVAATFVGLSDDLRLVQFRADQPGTLQNSATLTGVQADTGASPFPVALDIRPENNEVYILFSDRRLYKTTSGGGGALTLVGRPDFAGAQVIAMDFDPVADVIRMVGTAGANFRVSPVDGTVLGTDTTLAFVTGDPNAGETPSVEAVSYNGSAASTATTAFILDGTLDVLALLGSVGGAPNSANSGQLTTLGAFGVPFGGAGNTAFDIETVPNPMGWATDTDANGTDLYRVNLQTGALTRIGQVADDAASLRLIGLSVVPGTGLGGGGTTTPPPPPVTVPGIAGDGTLCERVLAGPGFTAVAEAPSPPSANLCLACTIENEANLVDTDLDTPAHVDLTLGLLFGSVSLTVNGPTGAVFTPASGGQIVGGVFALPPPMLLELAIGPDLTIDTLRGGTVVETATLGGTGLLLDIAGQVVDSEPFFAGFRATQPFDAIRISPSVGIAAVLTTIDVYHACSNAPAEGGYIGLPAFPGT